MTQRFFTSDLHIRHDLVVRERGFVQNHPQMGEFGLNDEVVDHGAYEAALAEKWDSRVRKDDEVHILGDLAMNPNKGAFEWLKARPGIIHLYSGNHDATHPMHSSARRALQEWMSLGIFATIQSQGSVKIDGQRVLISHFPYQGEGGRDMEDRHTEWRFRNEGLPLLHGHEHKANVLEADVPNQFHVGLDSWDLELVHELSIGDWLRTL